MSKTALVAILVCLPLFVGCDSDDGNGYSGSTCSYPENVVTYPQGMKMGHLCTKAEDCLYGRCMPSPVAPGKMVCSKQCQCEPAGGETTSACDSDNEASVKYKCMRTRKAPSGSMISHCFVTCKSASECVTALGGAEADFTCDYPDNDDYTTGTISKGCIWN